MSYKNLHKCKIINGIFCLHLYDCTSHYALRKDYLLCLPPPLACDLLEAEITPHSLSINHDV